MTDAESAYLQMRLVYDQFAKDHFNSPPPLQGKDQIIFWLRKSKELDLTNDDNKRILIDTFISSINAYDDKLTSGGVLLFKNHSPVLP